MAAARIFYACLGSAGGALIAIALNAPTSGLLGATFLGALFGQAVSAIVIRSYA